MSFEPVTTGTPTAPDAKPSPTATHPHLKGGARARAFVQPRSVAPGCTKAFTPAPRPRPSCGE
ncbi:MAG: hypothetical protein ACKODX_14900, partial [Gemmata sp.]